MERLFAVQLPWSLRPTASTAAAARIEHATRAAALVLAVAQVSHPEHCDDGDHDGTTLARGSEALARLFEARFRRLARSGELPSTPSSDKAAWVQALRDGCSDVQDIASTWLAAACNAEAGGLGDATSYLAAVARAAAALPNRTRPIWVANYLELLAARSVGVQDVPAFFGRLSACSTQ